MARKLAAAAMACPARPGHATWTQISNTVQVSCAGLTYRPSADWFLPAVSAGGPKGLVYLQHGSSRSNGNLADLAEHYAAAGFVVFAATLNLTGTPVYAISSPPYAANSDASGTVELTSQVHRSRAPGSGKKPTTFPMAMNGR